MQTVGGAASIEDVLENLVKEELKKREKRENKRRDETKYSKF